MRAAICERYGGPEVVGIRNVPLPVPKPDEVLIRVVATTVSSGDARIRGARFPSGFALPARLALGLRGPRKQILGTELAGVVDDVGSGVTQFRKGDDVVAFAGIGMGCHAEFRTMPQDGAITRKPAGLTFEQAAAMSFGGTTALHFLRDVGKVQRGERVLINGASGAVGTAAVQLAHHFGAHVTAVCSAANSNLVRSLGGDEVVDYATTDFAESRGRYDVIVDTVGNASLRRCRHALAERGRLLLLAASLGDLAKSPFQSMMGRIKVAGGPSPERRDDIVTLAALCEAGAYKPVVERTYSFADIADAHARVDTGRKVGSVVVTL